MLRRILLRISPAYRRRAIAAAKRRHPSSLDARLAARMRAEFHAAADDQVLGRGRAPRPVGIQQTEERAA